METIAAPIDVSTVCDTRHILAPVSVDTFLDRYWEQDVLLIQGRDPAHYQALFDLAAAERVLQCGTYSSKELSLVRGGSNASPKYYLEGGRPMAAKVFDLYSQGHTVVLYGLDRRDARVGNLARDMERIFNHRADPSYFLTPAGTHGLGPHFDTQEIFIMQLRGTKRWRLFRPPTTLPSRPQDWFDTPRDQLGEPDYDIVLTPGDLLYFPRGWIHEPSALDEDSLHITVGLHVKTYADLLSEAVQQLGSDFAPLRRALPPGTLSGTRDLGDDWSELLRAVSERLSPEMGLTGLRKLLFLSRDAEADGHFAQLAELDGMTGDTILVHRAEPLVAFQCGEVTWLLGQGASVQTRRPLAGFFQAVCAARRFSVDGLEVDLDTPSRLVLFKRLVREGLLRIERL